MNDTATLDKNPVVPGSTAGPVQPQIPVGAVGSKERGPINLAGAEIPHNLIPEVVDAGVEENHDRPNLTNEHFEIGIKDSIPAPSVSTNTVTLPMTEEEIEKRLKTGQDDESGTNLARLLKKLIKALTLRIGS